MTGLGRLLTFALNDVDRFRSMGSRFRGRHAQFTSEDIFVALILVACVGLGVYALSRFLDRKENRRVYNKPWKLFRDLCKAHQLDRRCRHLLSDLAQSQDLDQPARLFLEPERFGAPWLTPEMEECQAELEQLRDQLFAVAAPAGAVTPPVSSSPATPDPAAVA